MMANGLMIKNKDSENTFGQMEVLMKDIGWITKEMEKESKSGLLVLFMMECGLKMKCMDGVTKFAQEMEEQMDFMKVHFKMEELTDVDLDNMKMDPLMKEIMLPIKGLDSDVTIGKMEKNFVDCGLLEETKDF